MQLFIRSAIFLTDSKKKTICTHPEHRDRLLPGYVRIIVRLAFYPIVGCPLSPTLRSFSGWQPVQDVVGRCIAQWRNYARNYATTVEHHQLSSVFWNSFKHTSPPPHPSIRPNVIDPRRRRRIKADETAYYSRVNCENKTLFISEK